MATVGKDPRDGRWLARWRDPSGRQRKKSFARKVDAQRWLDQMRADMHRGQFVDPARARVKVGEFAETWAAGQVHLKVSTRERYVGIVRKHIVPTWGGWALGSVSHADVVGWVGRLVASGLRPGTVRQVHRVLSLILDEAVRDGRLGRNPAAGVKLPRIVRAEPRFLSPDEVGALVAAAGRDGLAMSLLAFTGLRFGELAALRVRRVDFARRRLVVAESVTEIGGRLVWSTPKTHQTRSVPFPPALAPALRRACADRPADGVVFAAPEGGPLRLQNWRRRVFDPAVKRAGLSGVSPHDLRHTAASLAIASGANVKAVQRMLGHASAAMTLDVYTGLFRDDLDAVAAALDALVPQMCHEEPDEDVDEDDDDAEKGA